MASPQERTTPTPAEAPESEVEGTEAVVQLLGADPWMRFDVWANRAWEAADSAVKVCIASGEPLNDDMDNRVMALFHAAQIAKEFSEMVNPLYAVANGNRTSTVSSDRQAQAIMALLLEEDSD
jgi:hypothetical protein